MERAQSPVESPLAGGFASFSSSSQGTFDFIFSWNFFLSFKQPESQFLIFEFFGCLKEEKKNPGNNYSQIFLKKMKEKKSKTAR